MRSTSSPTRISSSNIKYCKAFRRTMRVADGRYPSTEPGATNSGRGPMSSADRQRSYRGSRAAEFVRGRIRGATAATRGSSKCATRGASHPGVTAQSASTNATIGALVMESPVLRAAAGPRFDGCRISIAPCARATSATAVVVDPSSTTMTRTWGADAVSAVRQASSDSGRS